MLDGLIFGNTSEDDEHEQLGIGAVTETDRIYEMRGTEYKGISEWYGTYKKRTEEDK